MTVDEFRNSRRAPAFIDEAMPLIVALSETSWDAVTIAWNNGQVASVHHGDMSEISAGADKAASRDKGSIMTPRPSVSDFEMSSCHLSSLFLEIVDAHEGPHGLQAYHPARMAAIADLNATRAVFSWTRRTRYFAYHPHSH